MGADYLSETPEGVILNVRAQPRSSRSGIDGVLGDAVKVRIKCAPVDGKANKELIETLADAFDLAKSDVVFKGGETSKTKRLLLRGVTAAAVRTAIGCLCILLTSVAGAAVDRGFLTELLEIPSATADVPAVNRAVDLTHAWLTKNGIRSQVETDDAGRRILWAATVEDKTPDYVLAVHLDVVPAEADQFRVRIDGDRISARGAHDCKGNAAIACDVLRRLNGKASVGVIFASNEEVGGSTTGFMVQRGYRPRKMAIVLDAGTYGVFYAQKGNAYLTVRATGKGGHSSCAMWLDNPIARLTEGYEKFRAAWPAVPKDGWGDLVVPTVVRAGQTENVIPDTAEMVLNVRSVTTDAVERVTATLKDVAGLEVVKVRSTGRPMASDPNDSEIQRLLSVRRMRWPEKECGLSRMLAITDARHFAGLGVPVVITGSMGGNAHGKDEWGDLRNMDENADSLVEFLQGAREK